MRRAAGATLRCAPSTFARSACSKLPRLTGTSEVFAGVHTEPNAPVDDRRPSRPTLLGCTYRHDGKAQRTVRVRPGCGLERPRDKHPVRRNQHEQLRVLHRELLLDSAGFQWYGACGVLHEGIPRKAYCREDRAMASTGDTCWLVCRFAVVLFSVFCCFILHFYLVRPSRSILVSLPTNRHALVSTKVRCSALQQKVLGLIVYCVLIGSQTVALLVGRLPVVASPNNNGGGSR